MPADTPPLIADDAVLDMLNTVDHVQGRPHDFWQSDDDVSDWLVRAGWWAEAFAGQSPPGVLLAVARHLREVIRQLVEARKAGRPCSADALNAFLRQAPSPPILIWAAGTPRVERVRPADSVEQRLAALAEAAAHLLAEGDFRHIRQCEHPDCGRWFYDRTKAHSRRWCSMALCGNRHKVAAHRKRLQG